MPPRLKRFQQERHLHFITFSCYRRLPFLDNDPARICFEDILETCREKHHLDVHGYVLMPEHVHLLVSEPKIRSLDSTLRVLKGETSKRLKRDQEQFWQRRYHDFNVFTEAKRIEKLRYMHRNPVTRGLVQRPEHWPWSSFRHYATGEQGRITVESPWTAQRRETSKEPGAPFTRAAGEWAVAQAATATPHKFRATSSPTPVPST